MPKKLPFGGLPIATAFKVALASYWAAKAVAFLDSIAPIWERKAPSRACAGSTTEIVVIVDTLVDTLIAVTVDVLVDVTVVLMPDS